MGAVRFFKTPDKSYPRRCKTPQDEWVNTFCWTLLTTTWKWLTNSINPL